MNKLLELQQKARKLSIAINKLGTLETRSTDQDVELTTARAESIDVNEQIIAAVDAEEARVAAARLVHTTDPEVRGRRALCGRANVGEMFTAVMERRSVDGANLEVQQAFDCGPNQVPLEMLRLEQRAVTPGPTSVATEEADVLAPVFAAGAGAFLFVDRPTVQMGDAVYPVLTTRATVGGPHSDSTDVAETTGGFDADLLAPERIQASFVYKRIDAMRFAGLDPSLRMALNMGLEEKLDSEAIAGANGLLTGANLANHNVAAVTAFADYISRFGYARVDGRYAAELGDLRTVTGAGTYGAHGQRLPQQQRGLQRRGFADGEDGRRAGVGSRAGGGGEQTEQRHPSRASARDGPTGVAGGHDHRRRVRRAGRQGRDRSDRGARHEHQDSPG